MVHSLRGKKILITAGPTWVPIDSVRVISNVATAQTGILLAEKLQSLGAKVTLLLGPVGSCSLDRKIKLIRFNFFDELKAILSKELKSGTYSALIHSAAVADYRPVIILRNKINSGLRNLSLKLVPTPKLINAVKNVCPGIFLVGFKFKPQAQKKGLFAAARKLIRDSDADLVIANTTIGKHYSAYIIDKKGAERGVNSKAGLAEALIKELGDRLCPNLN